VGGGPSTRPGGPSRVAAVEGDGSAEGGGVGDRSSSDAGTSMSVWGGAATTSGAGGAETSSPPPVPGRSVGSRGAVPGAMRPAVSDGLPVPGAASRRGLLLPKRATRPPASSALKARAGVHPWGRDDTRPTPEPPVKEQGPIALPVTFNLVLTGGKITAAKPGLDPVTFDDLNIDISATDLANNGLTFDLRTTTRQAELSGNGEWAASSLFETDGSVDVGVVPARRLETASGAGGVVAADDVPNPGRVHVELEVPFDRGRVAGRLSLGVAA